MTEIKSCSDPKHPGIAIPVSFEQFQGRDGTASDEPASASPEESRSEFGFNFGYNKAVMKRDLEGMRQALERGANVNLPDALGLFAWEYAVFCKNIEMARLLAEFDVSFPEKTDDGHVLLVHACATGNREIIEILKERGAQSRLMDWLLIVLIRLKKKK